MTEKILTTPASLRRADKARQQRRREAGEKKVTFWTTPEVRLDLARVKSKFGSTDNAIAEALSALAKTI